MITEDTPPIVALIVPRSEGDPVPLHRILINIYGATWWIPVALVMGFSWRSIWNSVAKSTNDFVIHCYHPTHQRSLEEEGRRRC